MKVVIAPDKFAGTMTAAEAARAMARGWSQARPHDEVLAVPMADGGEGLLDVVAASQRCSQRALEVCGPLGQPVLARWLLLPDGRAVIEAAEAIGLRLVPVAERNPLVSTSYGLGQLILGAAGAGCREIVIGLGGSATVDGGAGMALAFGATLEDWKGRALAGHPRSLLDLRHMRLPDVHLPPITVAVDVDNPLLGGDGAAAVFAKQKGAQDGEIELLEAAVERFADAVEARRSERWREARGAGAAGGVGFALMALVRATPASGAAVVADMVSLRSAIRGARAVVTGEGSLDAQTAHGKAPDFVRRAARDVGAAVAAVAGRVRSEAASLFDAVEELGAEGLIRPNELAAAHTANLARRIDMWVESG